MFINNILTYQILILLVSSVILEFIPEKYKILFLKLIVILLFVGTYVITTKPF
jgi:hypothetical protein